jgi:hypothetical protein
MFLGVKEGLHVLKEGMLHENSEASDVSKMELGKLYALGPGKKAQAVRVPFRILKATDDMFKVILKSMDLNSEAYKRARIFQKENPNVEVDVWEKSKEYLKNPDASMETHAKNFAEYRSCNNITIIPIS